MSSDKPLVLLTGASGYVGGRLLQKLEACGTRLRCLARHPEYLEGITAPGTEIVEGDVLNKDSLAVCLEGVEVAYYLVHSMAAARHFEETDRQAAQNFAEACREAGVRRIVYLGGLADESTDLSSHMHSRHEVGRVLQSSGVQVLEFRASIIIGNGSLSYELVRSLVIRLPVMVTPKWVSVLAQPIAVDDVLEYLAAALCWEGDKSEVFEIGGPDRVSYRDIMLEYAQQTGRRRWIIPVPLLTPWLSSRWLGLVTPVYARVGKRLIDSLRHPSVVQEAGSAQAFGIAPKGLQEAMSVAVEGELLPERYARWCDSRTTVPETEKKETTSRVLVDSRSITVDASPSEAFAPIRRIGGKNGWYFGDSMWAIRGWLDLMVGGVGIRRGRRDPNDLRVGDVLDCWRVAEYEPHRRLRLAAEMKVPGEAWLEYEVEPDGDRSIIRQTATFKSTGVVGYMYWYSMMPAHAVLFAGMLRTIGRLATEPPAGAGTSPGPGCALHHPS